MGALVYPGGTYGLWVFLVVTLVLGGAAAWTTGGALARTWRPAGWMPAYMLGLAGGVHFLHYALFGETFFSLHYYAVDYGVLTLAAGLGFRRMRAWQMVQQYAWSYVRKGAFFWAEKQPADSSPFR